MVSEDTDATPEVIDDRAGLRFVVWLDDHQAELDYRAEGDRLVLEHTEVPEALAGHGLGGDLVQAAVDRPGPRAR